ncbi:sensor histidine kinase [Vibrio sp. S9_S30]|uniref:ATP-binding protein n=1 Tax=Vibrio sp. S9_S30 TaxID=2720226 RepID=UPI00168133BE|nr:sensor histidine kinase [Vibrio sp. S9_S30]MBD1558866.1 sensor histidine kinase [Vibrio sp. S9_S30]
MTLSGLFELLILTAAGFAYIKHSQQEEMGYKALGIAQFLAQSQSVVDMVTTEEVGLLPQEFKDLTDFIGATFIVIGNKEGIRLIHPVSERVGKPMKGGDNIKALEFGQSYVSYAEGSLGKSVRGKSPVFDRDGNIIGVVSVGYLLDSLQDRIEPYLAFLIAMALLVVIANAILSNYASRRFQKAILGFEPEEIGRLYVELDVTMSTIKEGVISIDNKGLIRSINRSACNILKIKRDSVMNRPMKDVLPDSDLIDILSTKEPQHDIDLYLNDQRIVANRNPIIVKGEVVGAVSSFRRRDEITELTKQLSQTREYADMLRSQTHEHRNKLNTISGLVQLGESEEVQKLIGQETAHYQALIGFIRETVKDPLVAGLLLGKTERARELGLVLEIDTGTRLEPLPYHMNAEDLVTILGNLIDNAFDAMMVERGNMPSNHIFVSISDYGTEVILEVEDSGCGLPSDIDVAKLVNKGVSSKAKNNRGVGLYLVDNLVRHYGGQLDIGNGPTQGVRATVYIPKEKQ